MCFFPSAAQKCGEQQYQKDKNVRENQNFSGFSKFLLSTPLHRALVAIVICKYCDVCLAASCRHLRASLMSCHQMIKYVCCCVCRFEELHITVVCVVQRHSVA